MTTGLWHMTHVLCKTFTAHMFCGMRFQRVKDLFFCRHVSDSPMTRTTFFAVHGKFSKNTSVRNKGRRRGDFSNAFDCVYTYSPIAATSLQRQVYLVAAAPADLNLSPRRRWHGKRLSPQQVEKLKERIGRSSDVMLRNKPSSSKLLHPGRRCKTLGRREHCRRPLKGKCTN